MHPHLEKLLKLQVIDYDLGELERSKDYLPDMMENLQREMKEVKQKLDDATKQLEEAKTRQKRLELEIKGKETALQKYQQQMMSIKTNKEYDALVAEIDAIKEAISSRETELLETIELVSTLEKDIVQLTEKDDQTNENNTRQLEILQEKVDSIGSKVSDKQDSRREIVDSIPRAVLSTYERVRRGKGGRAVVVVKKRACSACFKALTPKKTQEIKRADRLYSCDSCGSLLYWNNEESN
ncbi:MAG TPA: C4-type zinc ribbon domain-containing protein [Acidobacteriota bacterium]|nr:C4-type zinc ribbon domain-containing protein [Acidobacteriota bacterium]